MNLSNRQSAQPFPQLPLYFDSVETRKALETGIQVLMSPKQTAPQANIIETREAFVVELAAPGMEKENFSVAIENGTLHVQMRPSRSARHIGRFMLQEFNYQNFERQFQLPANLIDEDGIDAQYAQGILQISIPKIKNSEDGLPKWIDIK